MEGELDNDRVLRARYADLVWDLTAAIASRKADYEFAKTAIDSYLMAVDKALYVDDHDCFTACERALDVAQSLKDEARIDAARATSGKAPRGDQQRETTLVESS